MKVARYALLSIFACSVVACSAPTPVAQNFPLTYQGVARTAKHWDVVADDMVAQTATYLSSVEALKSRAVFIQPTERNTVFDASLRDFMINHMVDRGIAVSVCSSPGGAGMIEGRDVQVRYETRIIGHADMPHYRPGVLTALAGGIFVGRMIGTSGISRDAAGVLGFGAAAAADFLIGDLPRATHTEIVVTTTIEESNRFIMRRSDIYYVPDGDARLFMTHTKGSALCPSGRASVTQGGAAADDATKDEARTQYVIDAMRRSNPKWRPEAVAFSQ
jgi:hypothetical protein